MADEAHNPFSVASNFSRDWFLQHKGQRFYPIPLGGTRESSTVGGGVVFASPATQSPGPKVNEQAALGETIIF